jgi:hypothetical protein
LNFLKDQEMENKDQHWVPKTYLKAWIDPDSTHSPGYLWKFSKDGKTSTKKSPKNVFSESDFYTDYLPDGSRDLSLEKKLGSLESKFATIMRIKLLHQKPLTEEEAASLFLFVAAMLNRTKSQRDHHIAQWSKLLEVMKDVEKRGKSSINSQPILTSTSHPDNSLTIEQVEKLKEAPLQKTLLMLTKIVGNILAKMNFNILYTSTQPGFITSDSPCVVFDPELYNRPFTMRSLGLGYPSVQVTFPLSPQLMICFYWDDLPIKDSFIEISNLALDDFNRRTRFFCKEYFIVNKQVTREIWFKDRPE